MSLPRDAGNPALDERWGFCDRCEGWLLSSYWGPELAEKCPRCLQAPVMVERVTEDGYSVQVMLILPADAVEPAF